MVNPHAFGVQGSESPEAQAFVVLMHAAWKDWVKEGSKGASGAGRVRMGLDGAGWVLVLAVGGVVGLLL